MLALSLALPLGQTSMRTRPSGAIQSRTRSGGSEARVTLAALRLWPTSSRSSRSGRMKASVARACCAASACASASMALARRRAASAPAPLSWPAASCSARTPCSSAATFSASLGAGRGSACSAGTSDFAAASIDRELLILIGRNETVEGPGRRDFRQRGELFDGRGGIVRCDHHARRAQRQGLAQPEQRSQRGRLLVLQGERIEIELQPGQ